MCTEVFTNEIVCSLILAVKHAILQCGYGQEIDETRLLLELKLHDGDIGVITIHFLFKAF